MASSKRSIVFGLTAIPVKLTVAAQSKDIGFNRVVKVGDELHPVGNQNYDKVTGEKVTDKLLKGYAIEKTRYVEVTEDEIEAIAPDKTRDISIQEFVDFRELPPLMIEKTYYLSPDLGDTRGRANLGAAKLYRLLHNSLLEAGKVGIGQYVSTTKQHMVAIYVLGEHVVMSTLFYPDEIKAPAEIYAATDVEVSEKEVAMGLQLIEALSDTFDPADYTDTYRQKVLDMIEAKAAGKEIKVVTVQEQEQRIDNLMDALAASVAAAKANKATKKEAKKTA